MWFSVLLDWTGQSVILALSIRVLQGIRDLSGTLHLIFQCVLL